MSGELSADSTPGSVIRPKSKLKGWGRPRNAVIAPLIAGFSACRVRDTGVLPFRPCSQYIRRHLFGLGMFDLGVVGQI